MRVRYLSLDIFRGATVALMILVNNPGSFAHVYWPLEHAQWNGCTLTDLVFPFFLFAVGNSMAFTIPYNLKANDFNFLKKTFKRAAVIFIIGVFLNWCPFFKWENDLLVFKNWENVRIMGVLQRIALCYFFSSLLVYYLNTNKLIIISAVILIGYWLLFFAIGGSDPFSQLNYFGTSIDKSILGESHMYKGEGYAFEPEGLMSTIAAIVQVNIGYLIGHKITTKGNNFEMLSELFVLGVLMLTLGLFWNISFPINKKIWSSSYTILTSGIATLVTAVFIYFIEFNNYKKGWTILFEPYGKNPLFIFILSGLIPRLMGLIRISQKDESGQLNQFSPLRWLYETVFKNLTTDLRFGSMMYAVFFMLFLWLIGYVLYRKKILIKV